MNGYTNIFTKTKSLWEHLRCRKKRRKLYGSYEKLVQIPNRVWIDDRSQVVEEIGRLGDLEADTIIGTGKKGVIVTLVDRKSRNLRMGLVARRTKEAVKEKIISLLEDFPVHTITCDNGREFAYHEGIAEGLKAKVYFAPPRMLPGIEVPMRTRMIIFTNTFQNTQSSKR